MKKLYKVIAWPHHHQLTMRNEDYSEPHWLNFDKFVGPDKKLNPHARHRKGWLDSAEEYGFKEDPQL
jgi:hypothetical protein